MSNGLPDITINLSDPDDVRAHLPEAQLVASQLRHRAQDLVDRAEKWDRLVLALEAFAQPNPDWEGDDGGRDAAGMDAVVVAVNEVVGPISAVQVSESGSDGSAEEIDSDSVAPPSWPSVGGLFVGG